MNESVIAQRLESQLALNQVLIPDLWQQEAVNALRKGQDVVLHAPTGAGKTLIFELWCDQGKNRKQQAIYTVPTRALANDKLAEWRSKGWNVGIATGDLSENLDAPVIVATLETQKSRLIKGDGPKLLVIDEYQMLGDQDRGLNYEVAMAMAPPQTQLLLLSGSVANPNQVVEWLKRLGRDVVEVQHHVRPVPLEEVAPMRLRHTFPKSIRSYWGRFVASALSEGLGPILLFAPRRRAAEKLAMELAMELPAPSPLMLKDDQKRLLGDRLSRMIHRRITYHHSGLSYAARAGVIEPLAKAGQLRVVIATMGLASGINFSLRSVGLVADSYRRDYQEFPIQPDELLQMFGRAGRRGIDDIGYVLTGGGGARLRDAHPARLARSAMVDWGALLSIMHAAKDVGGNPFEHAVKVQQRLFTSKPIFLGVESAMENPEAPCGFGTDAERARYVKRKVREILNSQSEWENNPEIQEVPMEKALAPVYRDASGELMPGWAIKEPPNSYARWVVDHCRPLMTLEHVVDRMGEGRTCVLDDSGKWKLFGKSLLIADRLQSGKLVLAKWARRLTHWRGRQISDGELEKTLKPLIEKKLRQKGQEVVRFVNRKRSVEIHLNVGKQPLSVCVDQHGVPLSAPAVRRVAPSACQGCSLKDTCRQLSAKTGTAMLWRRLKLIEANGEPTQRGRILSFFSHGNGLAVAAALECQSYPLDEFIYDIANLHAGHRFSRDEHRWGGRLAVICHEAFGYQNIPGYLENGIPVQYGYGAESIVMDIHENGLNKHKWVTEFLGAGDIDRIIIEWRSLLRQVIHAPSLEWDRWMAFKELAARTLNDTQSPTLTELPELAYEQRQRIDHRLRWGSASRE